MSASSRSLLPAVLRALTMSAGLGILGAGPASAAGGATPEQVRAAVVRDADLPGSGWEASDGVSSIPSRSLQSCLGTRAVQNRLQEVAGETWSRRVGLRALSVQSTSAAVTPARAGVLAGAYRKKLTTCAGDALLTEVAADGAPLDTGDAAVTPLPLPHPNGVSVTGVRLSVPVAGTRAGTISIDLISLTSRQICTTVAVRAANTTMSRPALDALVERLSYRLVVAGN